MLVTVRSIIEEVVGADYAAGLDIGLETSFQEDLELESIEFVTLAELLGDTYGERVDFSGWLAGLELDQIMSMTVGNLVDYISAALAEGA